MPTTTSNRRTLFSGQLPIGARAALARRLAGRVKFVLSPYNCQGDPSGNNVRHAQRLHIPSAWADRTGTVYQGNGYQANMGAAGLVSAAGEVIEISPPGVESIVTGEIKLA